MGLAPISDKEAGHDLGPVPVHVTVVVAPNAGHAVRDPRGSRPHEDEAVTASGELPPNQQFLPSVEQPFDQTGALGRGSDFAQHSAWHRAKHAKQHTQKPPKRKYTLRDLFQYLFPSDRRNAQQG